MNPPPSSVRTAVADPGEHTRWFRNEVHVHEGQLKSYLRGTFPGVRDIDDVVQESYVKIWRAKLARPITSTKSFLFQVARNLAFDLLRRQQVSPEKECPDLAALPVFDDRPGVAEAACTQEELDLLARAIDALPDRCREVMILRQIKGYTQKEIAAQLGLSVLTVQTYVVRGLRRLEAYFRRHAIER